MLQALKIIYDILNGLDGNLYASFMIVFNNKTTRR